MKNISEEDLLNQISEASFENLFKEWYTPMCRSVQRIVQDKDTSEDIVQEVFFNFWNKKEAYQINSSLKSYLFKGAINGALTHLKKNKRWVGLETNGEFVAEPPTAVVSGLEGKELEGIINKTIESLPTACRSMFVMSRYEEMSYKEIAEATQTSVKTVENQISKALKIMRIALASYISFTVFIVFENIFKYFF